MIFSKERRYGMLRYIFPIIMFFCFTHGVFAQSGYEFPNGNFWSLDAGLGMGAILAHGEMPAFQFIIEPKLWLSPLLMVGAKAGVNYSSEEESSWSNILTFEGQVFMRWNFLRFGRENLTNVFAQIGLGLISAYRGNEMPMDDPTVTRGSVLADAALGVTIPLSKRWHIEPLVRGGYPHMWGFSLTAGYKFPLPSSTVRVDVREVVRNVSPNEIVKIIKIAAIEFIIFGPDIGSYNVGIDRDAQQLNELILNATAQMLKDNPDYRVRLEGHANPYTINKSEHDDLMALSAMRSNTVAEQLRARGVSDEQMVLVSFGGTRVAASEWDVRNRNRRVELMVIHVDLENN